MTSAMVRKRIGRPAKPSSQLQCDQPPPAVASEEVAELPPDIFTSPVDITKSE